MVQKLDEQWYAVKAVFYHKSRGEYEERIILIRADDFEDAGRKAEKEAKEYTANLDEVQFIEWVDIFHIFGSDIQDKTEVYSKLTASPLSPHDFIKLKYNI